jgi:hypothetical protein
VFEFVLKQGAKEASTSTSSFTCCVDKNVEVMDLKKFLDPFV